MKPTNTTVMPADLSHADFERRLFNDALDHPAGPPRDAWLNGACGGDAALEKRIQALLRVHDAEAEFLPDTLATVISEPAERPGTVIGPYKLREQVGEGGFGTVWVADQDQPVRRRVALKIIKLGMDTREVIARFEQERQALAMMDHPNIAKVLDAGTTDSGRPYFVMELVRGVKITDYCDQNNLGTLQRLELFMKVCHAVQHAHQKGIIHRDIKPSNILVTLHDSVPVPKVIDFGISKATEGRLSEATIYTQLHQFVGTPAYMSPEQAEMSGLDIDTRSDIYALGVLLYELLAGSTPFDAKELMASGIDAMRKTIREKEPVRPSTRLAKLQGEELTTTARRRSADTAKLLHQLKGDLDWIVMKCLEKDRTRRYDTAAGLAADIRRHLDNEPVAARPPSTAYRFQKAWRRNKVIYTAGLTVAATLVFGLAASIFALIGQNRAHDAEMKATDAGRIAIEMQQAAELSGAQAARTAEVVEGMLKAAVPKLLQQDNRTAIDVLLKSADHTVKEKLQSAPLPEFRVRKAMRDVFLRAGMFHQEEAIRQIKRMEELLPVLTADELPDSERLIFQVSAAGMHAMYDDFESGTKELRRLRHQLEIAEPKSDDLIIETFIMESDGHVIEGNMGEAERLAREAYNRGPAMEGLYNFTKEVPAARLANVLLFQGKYEEALPPAEQALQLLFDAAAADAAGVGDATASGGDAGIDTLGSRTFLFAGRVIDALCGNNRPDQAYDRIREWEDHPEIRKQFDAWEFDVMKARVCIARGDWGEAAKILLADDLQKDAGIRDWRLGALAALSVGNPDTCERFVQRGFKFLATADTQGAYWLYEILSLQSPSAGLEEATNTIRERLRTASTGWWTMLPLLGDARRHILKGEYQQAVDAVHEFVEQKDLRGVSKLVHRQILEQERHQYILAVAYVGLGGPENEKRAREAFSKGWEREQSAPPIGSDPRGIVGKYLSMRNSRHWAAGELTARGIEVPEDAITQ